MPSLSFTVTFPSLPTSIVAPSGRSGFAFLTASSTSFFSLSVKLDGSFTSTGLAGATIAPAFLTVLSAVIIAASLPSDSGYVIVTSPFSATPIVVPSGRFGLAFLTALSTSSFSYLVRAAVS